MSRIIKNADGTLTEETTTMVDTVVDGGLGLLKAFSSDDKYYDGTTVAVAQGAGVVMGLFVAAKAPQVNFFA